MVRFTLYGLLVALILPLPFILYYQKATVFLPWMLVGVGLGGLILVGLMSQRVMLDGIGVRVGYAPWVPHFLVKGWQIPWAEIKGIHSRKTGQGGWVHYLADHQNNYFLLPMRIAGFAQFLRLLEAQTGLDTTKVKPLAQPWMYLTLLGCVILLLLFDLWIIALALAPRG